MFVLSFKIKLRKQIFKNHQALVAFRLQHPSTSQPSISVSWSFAWFGQIVIFKLITTKSNF